MPWPRDSKVVDRGGPKLDAFGLGAADQRVDQIAVLDHMCERFARLDIAREGQKRRPGSVLQLEIGDDHVEDRLRLGGDLDPTPRWLRTAGGKRRR